MTIQNERDVFPLTTVCDILPDYVEMHLNSECRWKAFERHRLCENFINESESGSTEH
jgi:hypothetical protein